MTVKRRALWIICVIVLACTGCAQREQALSVDELLRLGEHYLLDADYEQALAQFLKVIEIDPQNVDAYRKAAEVYQALQQEADAVEVLERGYEETGNPQFLQWLDDLVKEEPGNAEEALPDAEDAAEIDADREEEGDGMMIVGPAPFEEELRRAYLANDARAMALIAADKSVVDFMLEQVDDPAPYTEYTYGFAIETGEWILVQGHFEDWESYENDYYATRIYVLDSKEERLYRCHARGSIINIDTEITATYEQTSFPRPMNRNEYPDLVWNGSYKEEIFNFTANTSRTYELEYVDGLPHGEAVQVSYQDGQAISRLVTQYDHGEILPGSQNTPVA